VILHRSGIAGAMSICAVDYRNTPAFGVSPAIAEHFSGQGVTPIYFDAQGTALSASLRLLKPDICAPDATGEYVFVYFSFTYVTYLLTD
jgi:hypothetical protein